MQCSRGSDWTFWSSGSGGCGRLRSSGTVWRCTFKSGGSRKSPPDAAWCCRKLQEGPSQRCVHAAAFLAEVIRDLDEPRARYSSTGVPLLDLKHKVSPSSAQRPTESQTNCKAESESSGVRWQAMLAEPQVGSKHLGHSLPGRLESLASRLTSNPQ